ncbi:MAG: DinB family protein, partial [Nitrospinota bacterium]|nr:DinB family protein [Nitrospinota bacterium]
MNEIDTFIAKYGAVVEGLAQAAEQVPDSKLLFKPSTNSLPWIYLIFHPSVHWIILQKALEGDPDHGFPAAFRAPENRVDSGQEAAERIRKGWDGFTRYIRSKPPEWLQTVVTAPWGPTMRIMDILWWLYEEGAHHRGQAWVYARINGIKPP